MADQEQVDVPPDDAENAQDDDLSEAQRAAFARPAESLGPSTSPEEVDFDASDKYVTALLHLGDEEKKKGEFLTSRPYVSWITCVACTQNGTLYCPLVPAGNECKTPVPFGVWDLVLINASAALSKNHNANNEGKAFLRDFRAAIPMLLAAAMEGAIGAPIITPVQSFRGEYWAIFLPRCAFVPENDDDRLLLPAGQSLGLETADGNEDAYFRYINRLPKGVRFVMGGSTGGKSTFLRSLTKRQHGSYIVTSESDPRPGDIFGGYGISGLIHSVNLACTLDVPMVTVDGSRAIRDLQSNLDSGGIPTVTAHVATAFESLAMYTDSALFMPYNYLTTVDDTSKKSLLMQMLRSGAACWELGKIDENYVYMSVEARPMRVLRDRVRYRHSGK